MQNHHTEQRYQQIQNAAIQREPIGAVGWSGKEAALPPLPPLRTPRASFPARGSSRPNAPLTGRAAIVSYGNFTILRQRRHPFHLPVNYAGSRQQLLGCSLFYELLFWRHHQLSRDERPGGSLPAFAWGDVAVWEAQPLSASLQGGVRFLHHPLPAVPSAHLTARFLRREDYGLTTFRSCTCVG